MRDASTGRRGSATWSGSSSAPSLLRSGLTWPAAADRRCLGAQAELEPEFGKATRDEWLDRLIEADVPCSPIHDYESLVEDQQLWENDYLVRVPHPRFGEEHTVVPTPIELSDTPTTIQVRHWPSDLQLHSNSDELRGCSSALC